MLTIIMSILLLSVFVATYAVIYDLNTPQCILDTSKLGLTKVYLAGSVQIRTMMP